MNRVILEHAHDEAAGVYRLTHAEAVEVPVLVGEEREVQVGQRDVTGKHDEKPTFEAVMEVMTFYTEETRTVYVDPIEVIWADDDEQWAGKSDEEVRAAQRKQVKDALVELSRLRSAQAQEAAAQSSVPPDTAPRDLGGAGDAL